MNYLKRSVLGLSMGFLLGLVPVQAQTPEPASVIDQTTIESLRSAGQIDFASVAPDLGSVESGVFALSRDGAFVAVRSRGEQVLIWSTDGTLVDHFGVMGVDNLPDTILDVVFNPDGTVVGAIATDGAAYTLAFRVVTTGETLLVPFPLAPNIPLRLWFHTQYTGLTWVESASAQPGEPNIIGVIPNGLPDTLPVSALRDPIPSGPESDPDAIVRVGRIPPPLAITSSQDGLVKRWDLRRGEVTASAQVETAAVFGGISPDGRYFAWRDSEFTALHLLDFETGEDRTIAPLNGEYAAAILVPPGAQVILAVDLGDNGRVIAWNSTSGERLDLGTYRACGRTPDMSRLSADGTTLVIGCDTGLDIWRVVTTP